MSIRWARQVENLRDITVAAKAGFQSVQLPVDGMVELSTADFERFRQELGALGLSVEVCSNLLPREVVVTESGFNVYVWAQYLRRAFARVRDLGVARIAWNNGRARVLPSEEHEVAIREQVMQFLYITCEIAEPMGITVLVEPLSPRRTNYLNTMEEVDTLIGSVGSDNLSAMVSLRDLANIDLPLQDFHRWKHRIAHVQMENPLADEATRTAPAPDDGYDYGPFLKALAEIRYEGIVTLPDESRPETLQYCMDLELRSS